MTANKSEKKNTHEAPRHTQYPKKQIPAPASLLYAMPATIPICICMDACFLCDVLNYGDTLQWLNLSFYYNLAWYELLLPQPHSLWSCSRVRLEPEHTLTHNIEYHYVLASGFCSKLYRVMRCVNFSLLISSAMYFVTWQNRNSEIWMWICLCKLRCLDEFAFSFSFLFYSFLSLLFFDVCSFDLPVLRLFCTLVLYHDAPHRSPHSHGFCKVNDFLCFCANWNSHSDFSNFFGEIRKANSISQKCG